MKGCDGVDSEDDNAIANRASAKFGSPKFIVAPIKNIIKIFFFIIILAILIAITINSINIINTPSSTSPTSSPTSTSPSSSTLKQHQQINNRRHLHPHLGCHHRGNNRHSEQCQRDSHRTDHGSNSLFSLSKAPDPFPFA